MKLVSRIEIDLINNNDGQKIENACVSEWSEVDSLGACSDKILAQALEELIHEVDMEMYTLGNTRIVFKQIRENIWK